MQPKLKLGLDVKVGLTLTVPALHKCEARLLVALAATLFGSKKCTPLFVKSY